MLSVVLEYHGNEFPTELLIDSGADYSILRYDTAKYGLKIPIETLPESSLPLKGITSEPQKTVLCENVTLRFKWKHKEITYSLPVRIMVDIDKQPPRDCLGRDPFFYDFRLDFRMGYTDDASLGKFIIYHEDKKRKASKFKKPKGRKIK